MKKPSDRTGARLIEEAYAKHDEAVREMQEAQGRLQETLDRRKLIPEQIEAERQELLRQIAESEKVIEALRRK